MTPTPSTSAAGRKTVDNSRGGKLRAAFGRVREHKLFEPAMAITLVVGPGLGAIWFLTLEPGQQAVTAWVGVVLICLVGIVASWPKRER